MNTAGSGRLGDPPSPYQRRTALGRFGERLAAAHLGAHGLTVLARNWRCARGELDLVALDPRTETLVFCEVKTRRSEQFGPPAAAVGAVKARRIRHLALDWLESTGTRRGPLRFDVISVLAPPGGAVRLEHLTSAF
jgi:putative endonuclease